MKEALSALESELNSLPKRISTLYVTRVESLFILAFSEKKCSEAEWKKLKLLFLDWTEKANDILNVTVISKILSLLEPEEIFVCFSNFKQKKKIRKKLFEILEGFVSALLVDYELFNRNSVLPELEAAEKAIKRIKRPSPAQLGIEIKKEPRSEAEIEIYSSVSRLFSTTRIFQSISRELVERLLEKKAGFSLTEDERCLDLLVQIVKERPQLLNHLNRKDRSKVERRLLEEFPNKAFRLF